MDQLALEVFASGKPQEISVELPSLQSWRQRRRFDVSCRLAEDPEGQLMAMLELKETGVEEAFITQVIPTDEQSYLEKIGIIRGFAETLLESGVTDQNILKRSLISIYRNAESLERGLTRLLKRPHAKEAASG